MYLPRVVVVVVSRNESETIYLPRVVVVVQV